MKAPELHPVAVDAGGRDDFSPGRADSFAFGVLLACVAWTSCGLAGCVQAHEAELRPQTSEEARVAAVADDAWLSAGLRTTDTACRLEELRIERPALEWYEQACPNTWACLGWQSYAPVAYMAPDLPEALVTHQAIHEWLHAAGLCYGRWSADDPYDHDHRDWQVWAGPGGSRPDSAEQRAQRVLDGE